MSMRVWVRPLGTTLGVAAAAAAAQLGIAYGIAILLWAKDFSDPGQGAWAGNLTWVCWLAATSVVMGVVIGPRVAPAGLPRSLVAQLATVVTAAVGALVTVPLVGIPARYAVAAGDDSPATTAVRIALVGVVLGAVVAVGVLLGRPLEWNTLATTGLLWLLALGSVLVSLGRGEPPDTARLAVWSFADQPGWFAVMGPMLTGALLLGAGLALLAKREGHNRVAVAVCGAPGPLVVAVAYLVAGPGSRPETGEQFLPYLAAPYAVLTGLLGSLLVAAIERPVPDEETESEPDLATSERATPVAAIGPGPSGSVDSDAVGSLDTDSADHVGVAGSAAGSAGALEAGSAPGGYSYALDNQPYSDDLRMSDRYGYGSGSGYGSGYSSGYGSGSGYGLGSGYESGSGSGYASGLGYGSGSASGTGSGSGSGSTDLSVPVPGWRTESPQGSGESETATRAPADSTPEPAGTSLPAWAQGSVTDSSEASAKGSKSSASGAKGSTEDADDASEGSKASKDSKAKGSKASKSSKGSSKARSKGSAKDRSKDSDDSGGTDDESGSPAEGQAEWDEDAEWLAQIRGEDRPRTFTPAPEPPAPRRRKWSLFGDDAADEEESAGDQR